MRVSLEWIADFVDVPPTRELCDQLVAAGVEVESIIDPAQGARDVVVAEVQALQPHPDASRLQICQVFDGQGQYQVVCGAPNVSVGMRVAFARVGGRVPGPVGADKPVDIARANIRGVDSHGMLCSRGELGLEGDSTGLWPLPEHFGLGADVLVEAGLPVVLELGITPNRPDLMCHLGVAREVGASTQRRTKPNKWRLTEKGPDVGSLGRVVVEETAACRRYVARVVRGLKVGPSPTWLKERLQSIGQRSINNVVDATNYVMHELGQPLHAFDISRIAVEAGCPTLRVRRAVAGEVLRTLDGVERALTPEDLVVADPNRPVALAGVMGGADAEVREGTSGVLIEAACFDAAQVRQVARRHGLRTESSQRFERGIDIGMVVKAVDRCAQILADVAEGEVAKGFLEVAQKSEPVRELPLRLARIPKLLGVTIPTEAVVQLLEPLEIRCVNRTEAALIFQVPSFRTDITREVDLIEEVARRYGYDRIPDRMPDTAGDYHYRAFPMRPQDNTRSALLAAGLSEVVTYGFGNPAHFTPFLAREGAPLMLMNPLGEDMRALRTTLLPGLLRVLAHNVRHGHKDGRFFEVGTTFHNAPGVQGLPPPAPDANALPGPGAREPVALPREDLRVACVLAGERHGGRWYGGHTQVDATDIAGIAEALTAAMGVRSQVTWVNVAVPGLNPYCSAELRAGDLAVGYFGQVDPELVESWDLDGPVFMLEASLTALGTGLAQPVRVAPLPRYPKTRRDLAVIVSAERGVSAAALQQFIAAQAGGDLGMAVVERVWLFDRYVGAPLKADETSLAFAIDYRSRDRTLQDGEVAAAFAALLPRVADAFGVQIRSA